jgi:amino acid transporter
VLVTSCLAGALVIPFDYRALLGMSNVAVAVQYLATCLAVMVLRRRTRPLSAQRTRSLWLPGLGAAVSLWIFTEASGEELLWALGSLAAGLVVLHWQRRA